MALLSLIYNTPKRAQIGAMQLDASLSESHSRTASVSVSPIEDGASISDHITIQPITLSITGIISDVPLSVQNAVVGAGLGTIQSSFGGLIDGPLGGLASGALAVGSGSVASLVTSNPRDPSDAFKYLEELFNNRAPFTVITRLKSYNNMVITNLDVPRSADTGRGLQFTIDMQQVTIVKSSITKIPSVQLPDNAKRGEGTTDNGKQSAKESKCASLNKANSILKNVVDGYNPADVARCKFGF